MAFRATPFLAAGVFLVTGVLGPLACNTFVEEQRGDLGQSCFVAPDGAMSCNANLMCVELPLDGGGFDGGECFPLVEGDGSIAPADEGAEDAADAADADDADDADGDANDAEDGDSSLESGAQDAESDAPTDSPSDALGAEAGMDAKTE